MRHDVSHSHLADLNIRDSTRDLVNEDGILYDGELGKRKSMDGEHDGQKTQWEGDGREKHGKIRIN